MRSSEQIRISSTEISALEPKALQSTSVFLGLVRGLCRGSEPPCMRFRERGGVGVCVFHLWPNPSSHFLCER